METVLAPGKPPPFSQTLPFTALIPGDTALRLVSAGGVKPHFKVAKESLNLLIKLTASTHSNVKCIHLRFLQMLKQAWCKTAPTFVEMAWPRSIREEVLRVDWVGLAESYIKHLTCLKSDPFPSVGLLLLMTITAPMPLPLDEKKNK